MHKLFLCTYAHFALSCYYTLLTIIILNVHCAGLDKNILYAMQNFLKNLAMHYLLSTETTILSANCHCLHKVKFPESIGESYSRIFQKNSTKKNNAPSFKAIIYFYEAPWSPYLIRCALLFLSLTSGCYLRHAWLRVLLSGLEEESPPLLLQHELDPNDDGLLPEDGFEGRHHGHVLWTRGKRWKALGRYSSEIKNPKTIQENSLQFKKIEVKTDQSFIDKTSPHPKNLQAPLNHNN